MKRVLVGVITVVLLAEGALAFNVPTYSYEEMFAQSDLVVIAEPVTSRDTGERKVADQVSPDIPVAGVITHCKALYVLKGRKVKEFKLHHFRDISRAKPNVVVIGGPIGISFDLSKHHLYHRYLMFLVREGNSRFAPFAGQTMVEYISIQEIKGTSFDD